MSGPRPAAFALVGGVSPVLPRPGSSPGGRHEHAERTAGLRVTLWRERERQRQKEEGAHDELAPWWRVREASATQERLKIWTHEAIEKAAPSRTLIASSSSPEIAVAPSKAEQSLQLKLQEHAQLVSRLQRFALLNEETVLGGDSPRSPQRKKSSSHTTTVLREHAGLDESRSLFADLLCSLRAATTAVVEAVQACAEEQSQETHLNLNLPVLRKAFALPPAGGDGRRQSHQARRPSYEKRPSGFAVYSAERHAAILCGLTTQVMSFMPLPFVQDPLLLMWFDEHSELWQVRRAPRLYWQLASSPLVPSPPRLQPLTSLVLARLGPGLSTDIDRDVRAQSLQGHPARHHRP